MRLVLPQMCSRTGTPSAWIAAISRCSQGSTYLRIQLGPDQRSRRVAHADQRRARLHLRPRELHFHAHREVEERFHKGRVVEEIQHQRVEPAQIGAHGARPFHPPFDDPRRAGALRQQPHRLDTIAHASGRGRVGQAQTRQLALVIEQRAALHNRGRLVVEPLHRGAEVRGFARRVGNRRYVVEAEAVRHRHLRIGQHAVVARVVAVAHAGQVGGEHHGDRHQRQRIGGFAAQFRENALLARHACTFTTPVS